MAYNTDDDEKLCLKKLCAMKYNNELKKEESQ